MKSKSVRAAGIVLAVILGVAALLYLGGLISQLTIGYQKWLAADGMTMLVVTHEMGFAREAADRVIFIDGGVIVEDSEPQEFFAHPKNKRLQDFLSKML